MGLFQCPPKLTMRKALLVILFFVCAAAFAGFFLYVSGFTYIPSRSHVVDGNYPATVHAYKVENHTYWSPMGGNHDVLRGVVIVQHQDRSNHTVTCRIRMKTSLIAQCH